MWMRRACVIVLGCVKIPDICRLREKGLFWLLVREGTAQQDREGVATGV